MGDALYLHYKAVARAVAPVDGDFDCAAIPFQNKRVAVVFWSKQRPNAAQIAVLNLTSQGAVVDSPVFTPLLNEQASTIANGIDVHVWGGSWSPDGRLLVVNGVTHSEKAVEPALWVITSSDWIDGGESSVQSPLVRMRVDIRGSLASDASRSSPISKVFFEGNTSSRCFLLTEDALLLKMEIQVAELLVFARSQDHKRSHAAFFKLDLVLKMTNWHAGGITAAAFNSTSGTLVVSGGLKNPSEELQRQSASSLSVWHVVAQDPFVELLDYTMVLGCQDDHHANPATQVNQVEEQQPKTDGLMHKMRHSFLNPLKMLQGDSEEQGPILPGSIQQLAISTDGGFLSLVDRNGRFRIRQIDACADVLAWQYLGNDACPVESVVWLGPSSIGFVGNDHHAKFGYLAAKETTGSHVDHGDNTDGDGDEDGDHDGQYQAGSEVQVVVQRETNDAQDAMGTIVVRQLSAWAAPGTNELAESETESFHIQDFSVVAMTPQSTMPNWQLSTVVNVSSSGLVQLLVESQQFDRALELAERCRGRSDWQSAGVDLDHIYQQMWTTYRTSTTIDHVAPGIAVMETDRESPEIAFERALSYLNAIEHDKEWVVDECLRVVTASSLLEMKELLATGLQALIAIAHPDPSHEQDRIRLLRYLYRLDTLKELFVAELDEQERTVVADEQCFDGAVFATFRDASILELALEFAKEGRVEALYVLFRRNAWNLLPHRTRILELLPATLSPRVYAHLLPAIRPHDVEREEEWQFYTLASVVGTNVYALTEVELIDENRSHDLTPDELAVFEACARQEPHERRDQYALWFTHRVVEMDSMYGQLANANELGRCGHACLLGGGGFTVDGEAGSTATVVSSTPLEEFLEHSERLYKCVHELQLPVCCEASIEDWSLLSLHDQVMAVVMENKPEGDDVVDALLHRLQTVFLAQRCHAFALDEIISWLCQVVMSRRSDDTRDDQHGGDAMQMLAFCAQLIHQSNPAHSRDQRWIQDDARLLRTAIDIVFAASFPNEIRNGEQLYDHKQQHRAFVDHLWLVFQSLPERKPDDAPPIAQLQVEVDGMEDLLVSMDVLANYGVLTSPSEIRFKSSQDNEKEQDVVGYALELTKQMSAYGLAHGVHWQTIWQDLTQLKTRVFGERVSQESMLSLLLRQLLQAAMEQHKPHDAEHDEEPKSDLWTDVHDLIANWVVANIEALPLPMDILIKSVRESVEHDKQDKAAKLEALARSVLSLPVIAETETAQRFAAKFQSILAHEQTCTKLRELFDLLSYGAVKVTRSSLRALHSENERLELVLQVFTSNPSHYKMSLKAQRWLREERGLADQQALDIVLDGVMYVAQLLQIRSSDHTVQIVLKAAYSALYCQDFDTAHRLAHQVITDSSAVLCTSRANDASEDHSDVTTLLLSLVLDLVSTASFRSWDKKIGLIRAVLSVNGPLLWTHAITDLLLERLQRLEAIQSLAIELGLSEGDVEARREQDQTTRKCTAEDVLLKELELVVDMLREENDDKPHGDRAFVLRLLQKGLQLVMLVQTQAKIPLVPSSPTERQRTRSSSRVDAILENDQWIARVVPQMAVMALRGAYHSLMDSRSSDNDVEAMMEVGFSYLVLLGAIHDSSDELKRVWQDEIVPMVSSSSGDETVRDTTTAAQSEMFIQRCHHFFLFLAASSVALHGSGAGVVRDLSSLRVLLDGFKYSSSASKHFVHNQPDVEDYEDDDGDDEEKSTVGKSDSAATDVYLLLAKECQELLHSQKTSQELEAVGTFLNDDVDLERFSLDAEYRLAMIRRMSTTREHLPTAKEFAVKYGIDEYECVLSYIWHSFFPTTTPMHDSETSHMNVTRQDQLEQAFRGSDPSTGSAGDDFLEQALHRPLEFGEFLLRPETGVYESLPGTDHVGILLVLRTVLECSKRLAQASSDVDSDVVLPLSKSSSDRVALLFMCLKRLKEISSVHAAPDFKLVCGAQTAEELLHGPQDAVAARDGAMDAIAPFLSAKTIKMLTKVLQKLHQMSASTIVMTYLDATALRIWHEHEQQRGDLPPTVDLAVYAHESCMPFLSVLSIDHLLVFHRCFAGPSDSEDQPSFERPLVGLPRYGALLTLEKKMEVVSDNHALLKSRVEALRGPNGRTSEAEIHKREEQLCALEEELVQAAFWFLVERIEQLNPEPPSDHTSWLCEWKAQLREWFAQDSATKTQQEDCIMNAFVAFCEHVPSLDLATLPVELALGVASSTPEFVARAVQDIYCKGVSDVIRKALSDGSEQGGRDGDEALASTLVAKWATTLVPASPQDDRPMDSGPLWELKQYISALDPQQQATTTTTTVMDGVYRDVVTQLDQLSSPIVRGVVTKRKQTLERTSPHGDGEVSSLRDAVVAQWKSVISQYEGQEKWMTSALLSHVLLHDNTSAPESERVYDFGLRVKAICQYVSPQPPSPLFAEILDLATAEIYAQFDSVFEKWLVAIEETTSGTKPGRAKIAKELTIAAASLLRMYGEIAGTFRAGSAQAAWTQEKESALTSRLAHDFGQPQAVVDDTTPADEEINDAPDGLWQALLTRGCWDERLLQWYTGVAYDQLQSSRVAIAQFYERVGSSSTDKKQSAAMATMMLLVCPFRALRDQYEAQLLETSRQLLTSPLTSPSTKTRLLELLLLRFELHTLHQIDGLESILIAFFSESRGQQRKVLAWTSTPEYYVCRLVVLKEYAAASRVVCALWNVHSMLWDLENARLVLGNYLQALACESQQSSSPVGIAVSQARTSAYSYYQRELL